MNRLATTVTPRLYYRQDFAWTRSRKDRIDTRYVSDCPLDGKDVGLWLIVSWCPFQTQRCLVSLATLPPPPFAWHENRMKMCQEKLNYIFRVDKRLFTSSPNVFLNRTSRKHFHGNHFSLSLLFLLSSFHVAIPAAKGSFKY